jgi:hypothetical protein
MRQVGPIGKMRGKTAGDEPRFRPTERGGSSRLDHCCPGDAHSQTNG